MASPRKTGTQRGGRKKPPGTAQGHRKSNVVELKAVDGGLAKVPSPPVRLAKTAALAWETFWRSPLADHVQMSDHYALRRWIENVNELESLKREITRLGVTVDGSQGQVRMNPLYKRIGELESLIHTAEVQFGMTPYARMKLGLVGAQGALTADTINERLRSRDQDAGSEDEGEAANEQPGEVIEAEAIEGFEPG